MTETSEGLGGKRALAAIVFTDAVGYSTLASIDEARALKLIHDDFALMEGQCVQFGGRTVKNTGDGLLLVFGSAVEAVSCALAIQQKLQGRLGNDLLMHRIGVHLGDVILAENDAQGDGVNVAARLQQIAPSGGILVSRTVYDVAKGKVSVAAEYLGPQALQNIAEPVEVYALSTGRERRPPRPPLAEAPRGSEVQKIDARWVIGGLVLVVGLLIVMVVWLLGRRPDPQAPVVVRQVEYAPAPAVSGPSAVAPNANVPQQQPATQPTVNPQGVQAPTESQPRAAPQSAPSASPPPGDLRDWVLRELQGTSASRPITFSGPVGGVRQSMVAWYAGSGRDVALQTNGVTRTVSIDQMSPWQVRLLAVGVLEQRGGNNAVVRRMIAEFARQNGLPDANPRR